MTRGESVVIVGGGIWGLSTAYHLARVGWTDVEVLERNGALFDETTSQAAGLVGQIRATPLMRQAIRYAIDLFLNFEKETDHDPGFRQAGSLLLALTPERMASFEEHVEHANSSGVEARFVDGAEMSRLSASLLRPAPGRGPSRRWRVIRRRWYPYATSASPRLPFRASPTITLSSALPTRVAT